MAEDKLEALYDLIDNLEVAMFTTRNAEGMLVSRPMATQVRAAGADLWFAADQRSPKIAEVTSDPNVNLSYYKDRTREWISISGEARVVTDRAKVHELYRSDWKAWFGDEGGEHDGSADDPRIVLIGVDIRVAHFLEMNKPFPIVLFEVAKGMITGQKPNFPEPQVVKG